MVTVNATTVRWTQDKCYRYDRVQEIFGADAKERFVLMCTFADGQKPLVVETVKDKFPFQEFFCFNNSALYVPSNLTSNNQISQQLWKLGVKSIVDFLKFVTRKNQPPLSLNQSKKVLEYREWLSASILASQSTIKQGVSNLRKRIN